MTAPATYLDRLPAEVAPQQTDTVREADRIAREHASPLLVDHSYRVYAFGCMAGRASGKEFNRELLFVSALFHDLGLTAAYRSLDFRFEVDGANAAREFLNGHGFAEADADKVWDAIALHTTPGIPQFKAPEVALLTAGVEADVLGLGLSAFSQDAVDELVAAYPRTDFKSGIIAAFSEGIRHKPETTFGNVKADVLAETVPGYERTNFCDLIRASTLPG